MTVGNAAADGLLSIGAFARITGLTVKTLRHYDRVGVLVPAVVDPASGYRYYTPEQRPRAEAIRALRRSELPLSQVEQALTGDTAVVAAHIARLERQIEEGLRWISRPLLSSGAQRSA